MALVNSEAIEVIEDQLFEIQERWRLCSEVASLPERMGEVVTKRFIDGCGYPEIATTTGLSEAECKQLAWDGFRFLKDIMYGDVVVPS